MGDDDPVSKEMSDRPEPRTDDVDRAPGGPDATVLESDVGASVAHGTPDTDLVDDSIDGAETGGPLVADQPLSAQQDEELVPDEVQEPEEPESDEQATDNTEGEQAPSG